MMVNFKFDALYSPEVGLAEKLTGSLYWSCACQRVLLHSLIKRTAYLPSLQIGLRPVQIPFLHILVVSPTNENILENDLKQL